MYSNAQTTVHLHIPDQKGAAMSQTYLTTDQLAERIQYDARTIRNRLKDTVLLQGIHYIRPFGGRKILFIWEHIERDMRQTAAEQDITIPMASGAVLHG